MALGNFWPFQYLKKTKPIYGSFAKDLVTLESNIHFIHVHIVAIIVTMIKTAKSIT